jgi:tetratricopeptide (TPR) repeat protein
MKLVAALLVAMLGAGSAYAGDMRAGQAAGRVVIQADAPKLAAWKVDEDALAVLAPGVDVKVGDLPEGVSAREVNDGGLKGLIISGVKGAWEVVQDGKSWLLRPGNSTAPAQSALLLRDGWRVGGTVVKPQLVTIDDVKWRVAPLDRAASVAGSVVGVVRRDGADTPIAVAEAPAEKQPEAAKPKVGPKVEPVAEKPVEAKPVAEAAVPAVAPEAASALPSNTLQALSMSTMLARGTAEKAPGKAAVLQAPTGLLASSSPSAQVVSDGPRFSLTRTDSLRAIAFPRAASELLPMDLTDIYVPGTVVSLTLPDGLRVVPVPSPLPPRVEISATGVPSASVAEVVPEPQPEGVAPSATAGVEAPVEAEAKPSETAVEDVAEAEQVSVSETEQVAEEKDDIRQPRLIPQPEGKYVDALSEAWQAVVEAPEDSERANAARLRLAGFYLAWQRPEEAIAALDAMPKRGKDDLPAQPLARFYWGLAKLAQGDVPPQSTFDEEGPLANHAKLWRAVSDVAGEDYGAALKEWPKQRGLLPEYPDYLREMAQLAQVTALVQVGDRQVATRAVDELVMGYGGSSTVPPALTRLQGVVRLGTKDEAHGLELLAKASDSKTDLATAYRAKYEFVKALQQRHELSDEQVIKYLNDLWFDWRGDALERDVLRTLADMYEKNGEAREALRTWQILVNAYPHATDLNDVTARMTNAFVQVFDPENPKTYDALTYLGLYYDFKELVPNDARGDAVQEQVGRLLSDVTLYERALPVLQQQLDYRPLDPASQGRLALMIAADERELGNAAESLKTLDKWKKVATTMALSRGWKVEEARAMMALERPEAAKKALVGLPQEDSEVRDIRIAADWRAQNWNGVVPELQSKLSHVTHDELSRSTDAQLAVFQLAYAYGQLKDAGRLDSLTKQYASVLGQVPQLADDLGAVAAGTGLSATVVVAGPLAPLTTAMVDLNRLTERMRQARTNLQEDNKRQQEYNDKMRYMDLLPPPVM